MMQPRPEANGRLSVTLRVGDSVKIALPHGKEIVILCDGTGWGTAAEDASFLVTAWIGCLLRTFQGIDSFVRGDRFIRIRLCAKVELSDQPAAGTGAEVYVSAIDRDRATVSIDAPREWRITRTQRDAA